MSQYRLCVECGLPMRGFDQRAKDHPDVRPYGTAKLCGVCNMRRLRGMPSYTELLDRAVKLYQLRRAGI